jgi:hypothetical protein
VEAAVSGLWHDLPCETQRGWTVADSVRLLLAYLVVFAFVVLMGAAAGTLFHYLDRDQFGARTSSEEQIPPGGAEHRAPSFPRQDAQGRRK